MAIKDILEYWKSIVAFIVVVVTATAGVLAWAEDAKQLIRAEQQLIHNRQYQETRVLQKRDEVFDNLKMIRLLEASDNLSEQEKDFVKSLREENVRLTSEIEQLELLIHENEN